MNIIAALEDEQMRSAVLPDFAPGDTVRVHYRVTEGGRERIQVFEGVVLQIKGGEGRRNFTVRRVSTGIGVERIFPMDSPKLEKVEVTRRGRVRRARLFYLRQRIGKKAKVKEARRSVEEEAQAKRRTRKRAARSAARAAAKPPT